MSFIAIVRALQLAATLLAAGLVTFDFLVLRGVLAASDAAEVGLSVRRWMRRTFVLAVVVGLLSWIAWLADLSIVMSGLPAAQALRWGVLDTVVTRTTFGHVWALRAALWVCAGVLVMRRAPVARAGSGLLLAICTVLTASLAWTGHALAANGLRLAVDALHLCAAAVWLGMLPALGYIVARGRRADEGPWIAAAARAAQRFSAPAAAAVLVLAITGVVNTAALLETPSDLLTTLYGRLLAGKLALFAALLVLAVANRQLLVPRIATAPQGEDRREAARRLYRSVLAETAIGALLLVVVGFLGITPPAMHEPGMQGMQRQG